MKEPNKVPTMFRVELSEPDEPTFYFSSEFNKEISPPTPTERTKKHTVEHPIIIHVDWVVDRSLIISELLVVYDYNDDYDTTRLHTYTS